MKIKELDFGPAHKNAYELVSEMNTFLNDDKSLKEHPDAYISEHFSKQRINVDLAREKLILKINQISEKLISEIELEEKECKANLSKYDLSSLGDDLVNIKADLSKWDQDMKYLVINDNLWTSIITKCSEYVEQLKQSRLKFEEKILGKPCELKTESKLTDIFFKQLTP
jgi:hypothetical protein